MLSTVLVANKSTDVTVIASESSSWVAFESAWSWVLEIVLVMVFPPWSAFTVAVIVKFLVSPFGKVANVQVEFVAFQTPEPAISFTKVNPAGRTSVITTFVALAGPLLVTEIV